MPELTFVFFGFAPSGLRSPSSGSFIFFSEGADTKSGLRVTDSWELLSITVLELALKHVRLSSMLTVWSGDILFRKNHRLLGLFVILETQEFRVPINLLVRSIMRLFLRHLLLSSFPPDFLLSLTLSLFLRSLLHPLLRCCYSRNNIRERVIDYSNGLYFRRT